MNWHAESLELSPEFYNYFKYDKPGCVLILRRLETDQEAIERKLKTEFDVQKWLKEDYEISDQRDGKITPGLWVMIPLHTGYIGDLHHLPLSKCSFEKLSRSFDIHSAVCRTISRRKKYFSSTILRNGNPQHRAIAYTASTGDHNLAVCATYNSLNGVTKAVVFGCDEKRREAIKSRIDKSGDHVRHPMLIIGILAEMERECLSPRADIVETRYITRVETFSNQGQFETRRYRGLKHLNDAFGIHRESRGVCREISAIKIQLDRMLAHIDELETGQLLINDDGYSPAVSPVQTPGSGKTLVTPMETALATQRTKQVGQRIRDRLLEISAEYEVNLETCDKVWNDLTLLIQIEMGQAARVETAVNTAISMRMERDNKQLKSLATLTMIFLPLTTVASVFSMEVFNWHPKDDENVIGPYFWAYLGIAGGLTLVTVVSWSSFLFLSKSKPLEGRESEDSDNL